MLERFPALTMDAARYIEELEREERALANYQGPDRNEQIAAVKARIRSFWKRVKDERDNPPSVVKPTAEEIEAKKAKQAERMREIRSELEPLRALIPALHLLDPKAFPYSMDSAVSKVYQREHGEIL